jgi:hypothetical protein
MKTQQDLKKLREMEGYIGVSPSQMCEKNLKELREMSEEKFFVVWSEKKELLNVPTKQHKYYGDAEGEALRLAEKYIGVRFDVLGLYNSIKMIPEPLTKNGIIKKIKKLKGMIPNFDDKQFQVKNKWMIRELNKILERAEG